MRCIWRYEDMRHNSYYTDLVYCFAVSLRNINNSLSGNITCLDEFIELNGTCHPRCDSWTTQLKSIVAVQRASRFLAAVTGVVGGFTFLVASVLRRQHSYVSVSYSHSMSLANSFAFPAILLVYFTMVAFILGIEMIMI